MSSNSLLNITTRINGGIRPSVQAQRRRRRRQGRISQRRDQLINIQSTLDLIANLPTYMNFLMDHCLSKQAPLKEKIFEDMKSRLGMTSQPNQEIIDQSSSTNGHISIDGRSQGDLSKLMNEFVEMNTVNLAKYNNEEMTSKRISSDNEEISSKRDELISSDNEELSSKRDELISSDNKELSSKKDLSEKIEDIVKFISKELNEVRYSFSRLVFVSVGLRKST
ncbi:16658_t:CDS:2 [Funneliformis mosseae]|uniref:16658_t:CDS:1 n=1 Tax=Funneliformis mosseae TaxID=27381 RepID=A0A9N9BU65_FUNMO|nr:16658_t:CDS:2 [Funneliformis mosseae]